MVTFDGDIGSYTRPDLGETFLSGSDGYEVEGEQIADPDDFDRNCLLYTSPSPRD